MYAAPRLRLKNFLPRGHCFHLARVVYAVGQTFPVHCHDFSEIFWIEHGRAIHLINGERQCLDRGVLTWIRPDDAHGYRTVAGQGFTMVNLAFDTAVTQHLRQRYFPDQSSWLWDGDRVPAQRTLSASQISQLTGAIDELSMRRQSRLDLEWFLLSLLRLFEDQFIPVEARAEVPKWLEQALIDYLARGAYQQGVGELADAAHRTAEHVNRTVRRCYGQTTSELLNHLRLTYAAKMLRMTNETMTHVAMESGFNNLAYFHRRFRRQFGQTPRHYRLKIHAVMR